MKTRTGLVLATIIVFALALWHFQNRSDQKSPELRLLAWVGYDEAEFVAAVEKATGAKLRVQTYVGGEQMYNIFTQAPKGTFDLVIVDAEYGKRLFSEGHLDSLDRSEWHFEDFLNKFSQGQPTAINNAVFAVPARWGALGLVYNTDVLSAEDVQSYSALKLDKVAGKIGIFDWYLPTMGVISLAINNAAPYDLGKPELQSVREYLHSIRPRVGSIQAGVGSVIDDLRTGRTALVPGIGEWASAALRAEGRPISYAVPREGGIMWVEALAIPASARNKPWSKKLQQAIMQPEILALLASRKAYYSQISRKSAYERLSAATLSALAVKDAASAEKLAQRLVFRSLPGPSTNEAEWVEVWGQFKSGAQP